MDVATTAGTMSTALFLGASLPMLVKALRTRDVASYSRGQLVMATLGNAVYGVYVVSLPAGPLWVLHGFNTATTAFMLLWHLRYATHRPARHHHLASVDVLGDPTPTPHRVLEDALAG